MNGVDEVAVKLAKGDKPSHREMCLFHKEVCLRALISITWMSHLLKLYCDETRQTMAVTFPETIFFSSKVFWGNSYNPNMSTLCT